MFSKMMQQLYSKGMNHDAEDTAPVKHDELAEVISITSNL